MAAFWRWNGSSWVQVPNGTALKYWNGSAWVNPTAAYYWSGSAWVAFWQKADPVTYQFTLTDSDSYRTTGWRSDSNQIYQDSYGFGEFIGAWTFNWSQLQTYAATRPVVKQARVYYYRDASAHGSSGAVSGRLWNLASSAVSGTSLTRSGQPDLVNGSNYTNLTALTRGSGGWSIVSNNYATNIINGTSRGLALAMTESLTYPADEGPNYMICHGLGDANPPIFEVTLDYV